MTPAESITLALAELVSEKSTLPVESPLLAALYGDLKEAASSSVTLNVHHKEQLVEGIPHYSFSVSAILTVSVDDDPGGETFRSNYDALWAVFDILARDDACTKLSKPGVFLVDGFTLGAGDDPDYQEDENGGSWTTTFAATVVGRA